MNESDNVQQPTGLRRKRAEEELRSLAPTDTAVDKLCDRFESAWGRGESPQIKNYLAGESSSAQTALFRNLLKLELNLRRRGGEQPAPEEYRKGFPEYGDIIDAAFAWLESKGEMESPESTPADAVPEQIGRYHVERLLGKGGFGNVYLAHDDELKRPVAVKVPHRHRVTAPEDMEAYLAEAQIVASLDHAAIVPVHDVGRTDDGLCFMVSKFIEGSDLTTRIQESRPSHIESAELVATVADALKYTHRRGLIHRDIKPGNILLDSTGKPYLTDFGIALKEEDFGRHPGMAGTLHYMSPEQARGEAHRVDGRSDLFSLGVVFYELLTGRRPFRGKTSTEVLAQITAAEPCPPRQWDDRIPRELERICLKALSKRASDRHLTATDLIDDLRHFLSQALPSGKPAADAETVTEALAHTPPVDKPVKIVPKGLRSFDAEDADFFLELLPGPRDRDGLPESIRFWKNRIEERDPDETFAVGLLYGPSGCGKSSLMKAGLLPRLADSVIPVYVEATADETETRLLRRLRKQCADLPDGLDLSETLTTLRRGQGVPTGKKVLLVLDQFEQWLHARQEEDNTELVQALRQCDGEHVQCVVMVRDDFWLAVSRFMQELEVQLVEGHNSGLVDLFDLRHTRKVLAAFGRAFAALPDAGEKLTGDQQAFLEQAAAGLSQEGKVVCVRLALFADMMKGKSWTPSTLRKAGGTEGIGVTFLEETFSATAAPPEHRLHQNAAKAVLKALLPEQGSDIRGHMRSYRELLEASEYARRPKGFEDLLRILDNELRLLTPTDPEGQDSQDETWPTTEGRQYQLTHDYLVPSLRRWLTRKQRETRRGRAELRLAERAALWSAKPENRLLPSLWEWSNILLFTRRKDHSEPQREMMRKASRYHLLRGFVRAVVLVIISLAGYEFYGRLQAASLVKRLLDAKTGEAAAIVAEISPYRRWANRMLREAYHEAEEAKKADQQLKISLALLPADENQVTYLRERLLTSDPEVLPTIRDALKGRGAGLASGLWKVLEDNRHEGDRRFCAACALATYDPPDNTRSRSKWQTVSQFVADHLIARIIANPSHYSSVVEALRPAREALLTSLSMIYRGTKRSDSQRSYATSILADYAADQPKVLTDLLADADQRQFPVIFGRLNGHQSQAIGLLEAELGKTVPDETTGEERDKLQESLSKRQANAAVALLQMGRPERVRPLLKAGPDPRARSYIIHRLAPLQADPEVILKRVEAEKDPSILFALLLSLGEYDEALLPAHRRRALIPNLLGMYRRAEDSGLHAAAEWLLRRWEQETGLQQICQELQEDEEALRARKADDNRRWYVNTQGQTMIIVRDPQPFQMGSPEGEAHREPDETLHLRQIDHSFAIAATEVTRRQFLKFRPHFSHGQMRRCPEPDCPIIGVTWYEAAAYCNWLSKREGIDEGEWCYSFERSVERYAVKIKQGYLKRIGYRLPTDAEWEYACRAGTTTSRYYGQMVDLLGAYAWYSDNAQERTWPVGELKPNDFGLFDMHGNAYEWCQNDYQAYPTGSTSGLGGSLSRLIPSTASGEREETIYFTRRRVLRSGSFSGRALHLRSAYRNFNRPGNRFDNYGFRLARTYN